MSEWEVNIKGQAGDDTFEICVIRSDNEHGKLSYGWFDNNKLLITHNGGPCHWPLTQLVWNKMVKVADEVAEEMNRTEQAHQTNGRDTP